MTNLDTNGIQRALEPDDDDNDAFTNTTKPDAFIWRREGEILQSHKVSFIWKNTDSTFYPANLFLSETIKSSVLFRKLKLSTNLTWPFVCVKLEKVIEVTARHGTWWAELRQQKRMREREESAITEEGQQRKRRCLVDIYICILHQI